ncbi:IS200/IS605 family transposase [Kordiimonas sp.]|uniref:IS200/IS605 family transposase n=1 Tax=Kordiimonas sp. TaxID=1970157 RepID=UPI003A8F7E59
MTIRSNSNIVFDCNFHVVWCSKYRRDVLIDGVDDRFKEIAQSVCDERRCVLQEMEVMPDHVHLLLDCDPQFGIHRLVKQIKGRSSGLLRMEFETLRKRLPTLWTNSYFVSTTGGATISKIKQYIESQKNI